MTTVAQASTAIRGSKPRQSVPRGWMGLPGGPAAIQGLCGSYRFAARRTVTVNVAVAVFALLSVAEQRTSVRPTLKRQLRRRPLSVAATR
jgi:hypothetical protein